jgi:hypothetical protein
MTTDSFEIMRLWIPLGENHTDTQTGTYKVFTPINTTQTEEAWNKASQLSKEGWELISAIPITAAGIHTVAEFSYSLTVGYVLLFKRRIQK